MEKETVLFDSRDIVVKEDPDSGEVVNDDPHSGDIAVKDEPISDEDDIEPHHHGDDLARKELGCLGVDASHCDYPGQEVTDDAEENMKYGLEEAMYTADGERFTVVEALVGSEDEDEDVDEDVDEDEHVGEGVDEGEDEDEGDNVNEDEERVDEGDDDYNPTLRDNHLQGEHQNDSDTSMAGSSGHGKYVSQDVYGSNPSSSVAEFEMNIKIKEEKLEPGYGAHLIAGPFTREEMEEAFWVQKTPRHSRNLKGTKRHQCNDDNIVIPGLKEEELDDKYFDMDVSLGNTDSDEEWRLGRKKFLYSADVGLLMDSGGSNSKKRGPSRGRNNRSRARPGRKKRCREEEYVNDVQVYIDNAWEELQRDNPHISNIRGDHQEGFEDNMIAQYAIIDRDNREMVGIKSVNPKQCHICGNEFQYEFHKKFHIQQVHPESLKNDRRTDNDKKKYDGRYNKQCFICRSIEFSHPYYLSSHMQTEHPETLIDRNMIQDLIADRGISSSKKRCPVCTEVFVFAFQLKYHIQKDHAELLVDDKRVRTQILPKSLPEPLHENEENDEVETESEFKVKYTVKDIMSMKNNLQKLKFKQELQKERKWEKTMKSKQQVKQETVQDEEKAFETKVDISENNVSVIPEKEISESDMFQNDISKLGKHREKMKQWVESPKYVNRQTKKQHTKTSEVSCHELTVEKDEDLKTSKASNPSEEDSPESMINENWYPEIHQNVGSEDASEECLTRKRGRGRPKKTRSPLTHTLITETDTELMANIFNSSETEHSQYVIVKQEKESECPQEPVCTLTTRQRHPEHDKDTDNEILKTWTACGANDPKEFTSNQNLVSESEVCLTRKRGRGRPRKKPCLDTSFNHTVTTEHKTELMSRVSNSSEADHPLIVTVKQEKESEAEQELFCKSFTTTKKSPHQENEKTDDIWTFTATGFGAETSQESNMEYQETGCSSTSEQPCSDSAEQTSENPERETTLFNSVTADHETDSIPNIPYSETETQNTFIREKDQPQELPEMSDKGCGRNPQDKAVMSERKSRSKPEEAAVFSERRSRRKRKQVEMADFFIFDTSLSAVKEGMVRVEKKPVGRPVSPPKQKVLEPNIFCETCSKVFTGCDAFVKHQGSCTAPEPDSARPNIYPCPKCSKVFTNVSVQLLHVLRDHEDSTKTCPFCGKPFAYISSLKKHMLVHTNKEVKKALDSKAVNSQDSRLVNVLSNLGVKTDDDLDQMDDNQIDDEEQGFELSIPLNSESGAKTLVSQCCSSDLDIQPSESATNREVGSDMAVDYMISLV